MNMENIGAKMLWIMIIGRMEWWNKISWKKYFRRERNRCLKI
jgi:hypothetical protein